jgi:hypothetical protein
MRGEYRCKYTKLLGMLVKNTNKISNKCPFVGIFIGKMYFFHSKICFENENKLPLRR